MTAEWLRQGEKHGAVIEKYVGLAARLFECFWIAPITGTAALMQLQHIAILQQQQYQFDNSLHSLISNPALKAGR